MFVGLIVINILLTIFVSEIVGISRYNSIVSTLDHNTMQANRIEELQAELATLHESYQRQSDIMAIRNYEAVQSALHYAGMTNYWANRARDAEAVIAGLATREQDFASILRQLQRWSMTVIDDDEMVRNAFENGIMTYGSGYIFMMPNERGMLQELR